MRGKVTISETGRKMLLQKPAPIDCKFLKQFPSYLDFIGKSAPGAGTEVTSEPALVESQKTPEEMLDASYQALRKKTAADLLEQLKSKSPKFFEKAVLKVLLAMGYAGAAGEGLVTGKVGDGGIDGVIKQDKLGLDVICVQAKRWESNVGRHEVADFVGSMDRYRASKGVMVSTSAFTPAAHEQLTHIQGKKVVLISGEELAQLMIEHNVGVTQGKVYELKEVSNDFFDEEEDLG